MPLNNKDPDLNITRQLTRAEQIHNQTIAQTCLIIILFLFGLYTIRAFVPSLIWGVIFAIACWPLYSKAKKYWPYQKPDFILPLLFSLVITFLFMFPFTIIVVEVTKDVQAAFEWAMHASRNGVSPPQWLHNLPFAQNAIINWWNKNLADPQSASHLFSNLHLSHGVYVTQQIGAQLFHRGLLFLFAIITLFFLFKDGESVVRQCLRGSRLLFGQQGENIAKQMISSVHGTVSGLVLVGLGQGIILGLTYYFVGIPHAALFGIMTAIAAMVPFCPLIAIAVVAITALLKVSSIAAISVVVIGCIVVFIADHFIRPALIGGSTKLPFIWVLIGILGGLESWGMIGLFVGPAIMAALMMLWYNWTANKKASSSTDH